MKFSILSLFPDMFASFFDTSIIKRAYQKNIFNYECVDIRDFTNNKHRHVDDTIYGGGAGMLMQVEPIHKALESVKTPDSYILLTSPKAKPFNQKKAIALSKKKHLVIICGHYEGVDARVEEYVDEFFSLGDFIMTGGELAAMVLIDAIVRLLDGSIRWDSLLEESYNDSLLECKHYTKPPIYDGKEVPDVYLSGNHQLIAKFRQKQAIIETLRYRPDLLKQRKLTSEEHLLLLEILEELQFKKENT